MTANEKENFQLNFVLMLNTRFITAHEETFCFVLITPFIEANTNWITAYKPWFS